MTPSRVLLTIASSEDSTIEARCARALRQSLLSDVADEPAAMDQLARIPERVGGDPHVADRSVRAAEHGGVVAQAPASQQLLERLPGIQRVEVKILDGAADALLLAAAEELQARSVDPEQRAVRADLEKSLERVLQEIAQFAVPLRECTLHHDAPVDFPFERGGLLLQLRDEPQSRLGVGSEGALGGDHAAVMRAHPLQPAKLHGVGLLLLRQRVRAVEREALAVAELVPQLLELQGTALLPFLPEQRHHLAEDAHPRAAPAHIRDQRAHDLQEAAPLRRALSHDPGERRGCLQHGQLLLRGGNGRIDAVDSQPALDLLQMSGCCDDDDSGAGMQPVLDELRHRLQQRRFLLVELHEVLLIAGVPPTRGQRGLMAEVEDVHSRRLSVVIPELPGAAAHDAPASRWRAGGAGSPRHSPSRPRCAPAAPTPCGW
jgi:hypothetical protein